MKCIDQIPADVKTVLVRVDYNLPLRSDGSVADVARIQETQKTIEYLLARNKKVVLLTHWGRPSGEDPEWSTRLLQPVVERVLNTPVMYDPQSLTSSYVPPSAAVSLCENVRFFPGEEANDSAFVKSLAQRGDVFVNEAFSVSHRMHASVYGLPNVLPAYAGESLMREAKKISDVRTKLTDLFVIVGGCKVATKLPLICSLLPHVHKVALGALLYYDLQEIIAGKKEMENSQVYLDTLHAHQHKLFAVKDCVVEEGCPVAFEDLASRESIIDTGPETIKLYTREILQSKAVFFNGPVGQYEVAFGAEGTRALGDAVAAASEQNASFYGFLGGGDTLAALKGRPVPWKQNVQISSSGGALLSAMTYGDLPGLKVLCKSD